MPDSLDAGHATPPKRSPAKTATQIAAAQAEPLDPHAVLRQSVESLQAAVQHAALGAPGAGGEWTGGALSMPELAEVGVPGLSIGTFYEGLMTVGYSSDAADDEVQADIVAAGYGT